jgi:hypothetical protein
MHRLCYGKICEVTGVKIRVHSANGNLGSGSVQFKSKYGFQLVLSSKILEETESSEVRVLQPSKTHPPINRLLGN